MGDDHDRAVNFFIHFLENSDQVFEAPEVNAGFWLIKDRKLGAAGKDGRDFDTLDLTAGQAVVELAVDIVSGAEAHLG